MCRSGQIPIVQVEAVLFAIHDLLNYLLLQITFYLLLLLLFPVVGGDLVLAVLELAGCGLDCGLGLSEQGQEHLVAVGAR